MGLLKNLSIFSRRKAKLARKDAQQKAETIRQCRFEVMEPRIVLTADPVVAGITYLEGDSGQDTTPDHFELTFQGGSESTQLTQFVINGDQDANGMLSDGDVFFDVGPGLPGTGGAHDFLFDAANSFGISESDILNVNVSDNGLVLTVDVQNFEAGDLLAFTIDVDEVENFNIDKIASGVEFEASSFQTTFEDQHYTFVDRSISIDVDLESGFTQNQQEGIFYDYYDKLFEQGEAVSGQDLSLYLDNETGQADRTAGAVDAYDLTPKPITISGTVYEDNNLNWMQDNTESGIQNVQINLQQLNEDTGLYEFVASTTTDANGNYEFGLDLNLLPGNYRIVQIQPDGYLDVGAAAGEVQGTEIGSVLANAQGDDNIISDINIPLGNTAATDYDFKEIRPASISGHVYHDRNDDGFRDAGEEGLANVLIRVTRVGAKDGATLDPFENTEPIFVRTDANGFYSVDGLPPGIYEIVEINNYPDGDNPLQGFVDGKDTIGRVNNSANGVVSNDQFSMVELCAGEEGVDYDFGELRPASISGYVSVSTPEGDCLDPTDPNHMGIAGVTIQLLDSNGNFLEQTLTDSNGFYEFTDLSPGTYSVVEVQPSAYLDGQEHLGNVDGIETGLATTNDRFNQITLTSDTAGTMYNFCEHLPAEIHGAVYHDQNDNGLLEAGEQRIGGVIVELLDADGVVLETTTTNAQGEYWFTGLHAGNYSVREIQPTTFVDGKDSVGNIDGNRVGELSNDLLTNIDLKYGDIGVEYNFGEIRLGSISGTVHADIDGDCTFSPADGDQPLAGVVLRLFDSNGDFVAETTTDENGNYSFDGLRPGEYAVREFTPDGYIDGAERIGTVNGVAVGTSSNDRLSNITLSSGDQAVNYDFCEHIPAELHGRVFHDLNNDGRFQINREDGIGDVLVQLFNEDGELVAEQRTDAQGNYWFTNLVAGTYKLQEIQPNDFIDGQDRVGRVDGLRTGETMDDMFTGIVLRGGEVGEKYDFGEIRPATISGFVHTDLNGNCTMEASVGDAPLAGVTLELLNADGEVIGTTQTDENGFYEFNNVLPGEYSIREIQPTEYFNGGIRVGSGDGEAGNNLITNINIESGQNLVQYNFCERPGAEIHGRVWEDGPAFESEDGTLPDNYRELRDGVYTEGVDSPIAGVEVFLYFVNRPENGELVTRAVTIGDVLPGIYDELGTDPSTPISTVTDENGQYWFTGLQAGNYAVLEQQPEGFIDADDIPGTTTGMAVNEGDPVPQFLLGFSGEQQMDAVVGINVGIGQASFQNNFTEVSVTTLPDGPVIFPPTVDPPPTDNPVRLNAGIQGLPGLFGARPISTTELVGSSRTVAFQAQVSGASPYTWHLSVVNAGQPRANIDGGSSIDSIWKQASFIAEGDWQRFDMTSGLWVFTESRSIGDIAVTDDSAEFGMLDGIPLAGDFDGDGNDELAVFHSGYWMIDLNHNGRWDEQDLLATLGDEEDRPVVGDWDGDGKDDIGIYGPIWERDPAAIARDPGLPNPDNDPDTKPKNVPPVREDATNGARVMKLTSFGKQRVDVVDHVFGMGDAANTPITGDWNGNGIRSIGYFNSGHWQFDVNGDGRFDFEDATADFGQAGDIPLVGDFNGDGIEEIAVYRSGTWLIDTNGNRELDAADLTFELGGEEDRPVVGDWDGDGIDEPAIYRQANNQF